jgi:hypothetical protein
MKESNKIQESAIISLEIEELEEKIAPSDHIELVSWSH